MIRQETSIEFIRWICLLPTAELASIVTQRIAGMLTQFGRYGSGDSHLAYWLRVFLCYLVSSMVFVIAGAKMAPRHQSAAAIVLTVLGILLSLMVHVAGQILAGNNVGLTNYAHFTAESAGALCGAALVIYMNSKTPHSAVPPSRI